MAPVLLSIFEVIVKDSMPQKKFTLSPAPFWIIWKLFGRSYIFFDTVSSRGFRQKVTGGVKSVRIVADFLSAAIKCCDISMQSVPYKIKILSAKFPCLGSLIRNSGFFADTLCAFDAGATATKNVFRSVTSPTIS